MRKPIRVSRGPSRSSRRLKARRLVRAHLLLRWLRNSFGQETLGQSSGVLVLRYGLKCQIILLGNDIT
ncbi:uncharacterized protein METZ01_LOCUS174798 [marine metagenome]|uniref:Uncharacterized protein n=1 Tax=marine metagenome TaxID=408172 RepID=A0A382C7S4_9ZZZZ